ncbi:MAG TPA: adenylate/guanylate cyclase domain-containing protein, partial [Myxococcaceae bacterium]|nr:adenylate/guanylate cyclase domain-containing protein [Myxococcaceae bacterium]
VEPEQDEDGKLRRTRFVYADETNAYAVMPVVVAAHLLGAERLELTPGRLRLGGRELDISLDGTARIDFGGTLRDRFRIISLSQVVQDMKHLEAPEGARRFELEEALFKDKVVVIGGFATGTHDQKATPFESNAPGVMKQASMLESLLHGRFIVDAPPWASPLYALVLALLSFALIFGVRHTWAEAVWPPLGLLAIFVLSGLLVTRGHVFLSIATPSVALGLSSFGAIMVNHLLADRERERMRQMFSRYLSKQVVSQLVEQEKLPELSGENMQVTAFFSDIRGFSTFSEKYKEDARGLVRILNTYLTRVSAVLMDHGACLDKYIGDAVVCIFGAPVRYPNHAVRACEGALAAQAEVSRLREEFRQQGLPDVYTRIGLNSAEMFVGNIGSEQLFNYTAIGDGMNLAARLEGANKNFGSGIMIGPLTYELAKDAIEARELDWVRVAGKTEPVAVYELLAMKGGISPTKRRVVELYHQALGLYRAGDFEEAEKAFARALEVDPEDGPAQAMRARCKKLMLHPPPMPFDGVANLEK